MPTETFKCLDETSLKKRIDEITAAGGRVVAIVKQPESPSRRRTEGSEGGESYLVAVDWVMQ